VVWFTVLRFCFYWPPLPYVSRLKIGVAFEFHEWWMGRCFYGHEFLSSQIIPCWLILCQLKGLGQGRESSSTGS